MGWLYELDIAERIIPGKVPIDTFLWHLGRYHFAKHFCKSKDVIDVGCGTGYGSYYLAKSGANRVIGIDISPTAIKFAKSKYKLNNLEFYVGDISKINSINIPYSCFDVIVALECIEHLKNPKNALANFKLLLKEKGVLIISTPNKVFSQFKNPYHLHEFTVDTLTDFLSKNFSSIKVFGQQKFEEKRGRINFSQIVNFLPKRVQKIISRTYTSLYDLICIPISPSIVWLYYRNPSQFEDKIVNMELPSRYKVRFDYPKKISEQYKVIIAVCTLKD